MEKGAITKTGTPATTLQKPTEEANPYDRFGYGLLKTFNHTRGQVSVPMNDDPAILVNWDSRLNWTVSRFLSPISIDLWD